MYVITTMFNKPTRRPCSLNKTPGQLNTSFQYYNSGHVAFFALAKVPAAPMCTLFATISSLQASYSRWQTGSSYAQLCGLNQNTDTTTAAEVGLCQPL